MIVQSSAMPDPFFAFSLALFAVVINKFVV